MFLSDFHLTRFDLFVIKSVIRFAVILHGNSHRGMENSSVGFLADRGIEIGRCSLGRGACVSRVGKKTQNQLHLFHGLISF